MLEESYNTFFCFFFLSFLSFYRFRVLNFIKIEQMGTLYSPLVLPTWFQLCKLNRHSRILFGLIIAKLRVFTQPIHQILNRAYVSAILKFLFKISCVLRRTIFQQILYNSLCECVHFTSFSMIIPILFKRGEDMGFKIGIQN